MDYIYNNKYYAITVLDDPIFDHLNPTPPLSYGVVNIKYGVTETYSTFLPAAIQVAVRLNKELEEVLPESGTVIHLNPDGVVA